MRQTLRISPKTAFAFVTSVQRPLDRVRAGDPLNAAIDLYTPSRQFRLTFDSHKALDTFCRAVVHLLDDCNGNCRSASVRVFAGYDDNEPPP